MITKRIAGRKDGKSSASDALSYGEGLTPDRETGEVLDKSHRTRFGNFGIIDDGVFAGAGIEEMGELIELAAIEMQANCDQNTRIGSAKKDKKEGKHEDKKLAHFVFSYGQEKPGEEVLRDTEDSMLEALKLENNHFVTFLHDDNGYWHLHIFSSLIEKGPLHRGNPLWHDQIKRDKVCREVETRHALQHDHGLHEVDKDGRIVEVPRQERIARREAKKPEITDAAKKKEIYSGEKSFQTWVMEIRLGDRLKHAKSWQDLHAAAAAYGCEVRTKSGGFVVCPAGEKGGIQLSKIGLKGLEAKLGAFQAAKIGHQAEPENKYKPGSTLAEGASHYDKWNAAKAAYKPIKAEQNKELRESHSRTRAELRNQHKLELKTIKSSMKGAVRAESVSVAIMRHIDGQAALTEQFARDRSALINQLAANGPGNVYRDYLIKEAQKGDEKALVLAQKYGAREATKVARQREADHLQITAAVTGFENKPAIRIKFTHRIERNGTVIFNLGQGRILTDSAISRQVQLNNLAANSPEAVATALQFASAKFGKTLTLYGPPEFQRLAVETAVNKGLWVRFADPSLDAYREKLLQEKQENSFNHKRQHPHLTHGQIAKGVNHVLNITHDRGIPPNPGQLLLHAEPDRRLPPTHRRGSLHELPSGGLDGDGQNGEVLLPDSLRIHLGDGLPWQDPDMRRPGTGETGSRTNSGSNTGRTGRTGQPTGAEGSGYDHLAPPGVSVGIVRPGGSDTGGRPAAHSERIDLHVASSPNESRVAEQAQRAAAQAAKEFTMPPRPTGQEWLAANQDKPVVDPHYGVGRVAYVADDGKWVHDLGRVRTLRQSDSVPQLGDTAGVDKEGVHVLRPAVEKEVVKAR